MGAQVLACKDQAHWEVTRNTSKNWKKRSYLSEQQIWATSTATMSMFLKQMVCCQCLGSAEARSIKALARDVQSQNRWVLVPGIHLMNDSAKMHWARLARLYLRVQDASYASQVGCARSVAFIWNGQICGPLLALYIHSLVALCIQYTYSCIYQATQ